VTAERPTAVETETGIEIDTVSMPKSPNRTHGDLVLAQSDQIREPDMSISRGLRSLVTTGIAEENSDVEALQEEVGGERSVALEATVSETDEESTQR
jgi:uncharacterized membrane protein